MTAGDHGRPAPAGPDRDRWGRRDSYKPGWDRRARLAAELVPDGIRVLEIGVGAGTFKTLVAHRIRYAGCDLEPLDAGTQALDLDNDPLPGGGFDCAVLLGVFSYLHRPEAAAQKLCAAADRVIVSYCCRRNDTDQAATMAARQKRGWINHFDHAGFVGLFERHGHRLAGAVPVNETDDFRQFILDFRRCSPDDAQARA